MKLLIAATLTATVLVPTAVRADCARVDLAPDLITKDGATIPSDGGYLIGWKEAVNGPVNNDPAHPKWVLEDNKGRLTPVPETLVAGLVVNRVAGSGGMTLADDKGAKIATFTRDANLKSPVVGSPRVGSITLTARQNRYSEGRTATATLQAAPPADAVAVITYATRNKKRTAIGFQRVTGSKVITTFSDPGHCSFLPTGIEPPKLGEQVTLAFVDQFGRISPPSSLVKVVAGKTE